jgi:hypothetical protein
VEPEKTALRTFCNPSRLVIIQMSGTARNPLPANWEALCAEHTAAEITRLLGVGFKVVKRWMKETEIEPRPYDRKGVVPVNRKPQAIRQMGVPHKAIIRDKPRSIWDDAADVLRHYGPVYRCDEKGTADQKGRYWRAGMVILTPDDLLARADRYRRRAA